MVVGASSARLHLRPELHRNQIGHLLPGLNNTPQPVHVTVAETLRCLVPTRLLLTGGTGDLSFTDPTGLCQSLLKPLPHVTRVYSWNDGSSSTVLYTRTELLVLPTGDSQVTQTGTVQSGVGAGAAATSVVVLASTALTACETSQGLTSMAGPVTVAFIL